MGKIRIKQVGINLESLEKNKGRLSKAEEKRKAKRLAKKLAKKREKEEKKEEDSRPEAVDRTASAKKTKKRPKKRSRSSRYKALVKKRKAAKTILEAIKLAKETSNTKFEGSIDVHINVVKTGFRTTVSLPYSSGKKRSILIFTANPKALKSTALKEFKSDALNIQIAGPEKVTEIKNSGSLPRRQAGSAKVDEVWATADIMPKIAPIAKILGPKGLMPNPKSGTILKLKSSASTGSVALNPIKKKIQQMSAGKITLATEKKAPIIHTVLGKATMSEKELTANLEAIISAIGPKNIKKLTLASTMGPGIRLSLNNK